MRYCLDDDRAADIIQAVVQRICVPAILFLLPL
jgi:hypothetical protein